MARSRNIKPSFFTNDVLAENDPLGRLLFIGLWTLADHKGNLEWRAKRVKAQLLPYDECDVESLAINLDKSGFIRFYSVAGQLYLNIPTFADHQNPHKNEREKGTEVPDYSDEARQAIDIEGLAINRDKSREEHDDSDSDRADSLLLIPDSFNLIPDTPLPDSGESVAEKPAKVILTARDLVNDYGISQQHAAEWLAVRKKKRLTLTKTAMDDMITESGKAGLTLNDAIQMCIKKSWGGFEARFLNGKHGGQQQETPQERGERMARERGYIQ